MKWLALVLVLSATTARAEPLLGYVPDLSGPSPDRALRFELGGGFAVGNLSLGRIDDLGGGAYGEAAARYDQLAIAAQYGWSFAQRARSGENPPWESVRTVALEGRYTLWSAPTPIFGRHATHASAIAREGYWVALRAGRENVYEHPGDDVARTIWGLGVGITDLYYLDDSHVALSLAVHVQQADNPYGGTDHEVCVTFGGAYGS